MTQQALIIPKLGDSILFVDRGNMLHRGRVLRLYAEFCDAMTEQGIRRVWFDQIETVE